MPSSTCQHISDVAGILLTLAPRSFLDVGCGFGRWGFLAREYCDIWHERYAKATWQTRIDAVEVFSDYLCPHHEYLYDNIYVTKIQEFVKTMPRYDVVYAGDVIEHLTKPEAEGVLNVLASKFDKALIVAIPLEDGWEQEGCLGNPHEAHRSTWTVTDLKKLGANYIKIYEINSKLKYGLAIWSNISWLQSRETSDPLHRAIVRRVRGAIRRICACFSF